MMNTVSDLELEINFKCMFIKHNEKLIIIGYNNCIEPKIEKILRKNHIGFRRNRFITSQIFTLRRILEGVRAKNLEAKILFVDFSKVFDSTYRGKMKQILLAYGLPKETVEATMKLYRNESKSPLPGWRHRLLRHCSRCSARRHVSPILHYHLSWLRA